VKPFFLFLGAASCPVRMTTDIKIRPSQPMQWVRFMDHILVQVWLDDWRNIAITLIAAEKGEVKAQACDNA
jgi:hypothetical protein